MQNTVHTVHRAPSHRPVRQVSLESLDALEGFTEVLPETSAEVVSHPDACPLLQQAAHERRANETSASSHQVETRVTHPIVDLN